MKRILSALLMLLPPAGLAAAEPPLRITIAYEWYGWGHVSQSWVIERGADGMDRRRLLTDGGAVASADAQVLPGAAVDALLDAVVAPALAREAAVAGIAAGIDRDAVARLDPAVASLPSPTCSFAQRQAWARRMLTPQELQRRVDHHFGNSLWTDDWPSMTVTVQRPGQATVVFFSSSQKALMLPWKRWPMGSINADAAQRLPDEWRPALSRAVDALLPASDDTRSRFRSGWLQRRLHDDLSFASLQCRRSRLVADPAHSS